MLTTKEQQKFYLALIEKNSEYEGVFFVGIKTTGIFCRPTCSARKPKLKNCEFFMNVQDALLAGYRPCKRCHPLIHPKESSHIIKTLVELVESNPDKRWKECDPKAFSIDVSTARRQFRKRFGMTFVAYARARRMGLALKQIRAGKRVIDAQIDAGYESGSGFRDAFFRIMGSAPNASDKRKVLKAEWLDTPLGPMIAIADDEAIYLLEFTDRRGLEREIERQRKTLKIAIVPGRTGIIDSIENELAAYFAGELHDFDTPFALHGSDFQKSVWSALREIPYGETRSYADLSQVLGIPKAFRAVARANGTNQLAIIIPCHRIINANGELGGYGGGLVRKKWLIEHEEKYLNVNSMEPVNRALKSDLVLLS